jgi:hypothetical protein
MQLTREDLKQDLDHLSRKQIQQVGDFIAFLKFRDQAAPPIDTQRFEAIAEFANEDRAMAEAGMDEYAALLSKED